MCRAAALVIGLLVSLAPATLAQRGGGPQRSSAALVQRDLRLGFTPASVQAARVDLELLRPGELRRSIALMTLGAAGSVASRPVLVQNAVEGVLEDRIAALLALGELRAEIGDGLDLLINLASVEGGEVREAALVALARTGERRGREALRRLASGEGALAAQAESVMTFAIDPEVGDAPTAWRKLFELRWEAARAYGTVDGRPWRLVRIDELTASPAFLEQLVLLLAPDIEHPFAHDVLLEILMEGGGAGRVVTAVRAMPDELERLVEAEIWRPTNRAEWFRLVDTILRDELWAGFRTTLSRGESVPAARPIIAALLHEPGTRYEPILLEALASDDVAQRANAAYAVGAAGLMDYLTVLRDLSEDADPWVRSAAMVARLRMGESAALREAERLLLTPRERREPRMTAFLFELLERAAPDTDVMAFLERMLPALAEADAIEVEAILVLHGRRTDKSRLRTALPALDPISPTAVRVVQALGFRSSPDDLQVLSSAFPFEGAPSTDAYAAAALVRGRHRSVDPLLKAAVWNLPRNESILAAAITYEMRGADVLRQWLVRPPRDAADADLRRIGYVLGAWGGKGAVDDLERDLGGIGSGDEPALAGAYLGMFAARTR